MPDPCLYRRVRALVAWTCRVLYRVEIEGAERIPAVGGCILAANHDSSIDPALVALTTARPIRFLARAELWQPGLRTLLDRLGGIPVRRGQGDRGALRAAMRTLREGGVVAVFPQATTLRFKDRRYRGGAARLALATGVPLVPIRLTGTARAFSIAPPRIGFPKLRVLVGEPIHAVRARPVRELVDELTERLELTISGLAPAARRPRGC
jgi:1-acyl-sn-glycerol-3-phosphate acyltransferase